MAFEYLQENEGRVLLNQEAYQQIGHSGSLMKAVLAYVDIKVN
jgi:hypothetical protein